MNTNQKIFRNIDEALVEIPKLISDKHLIIGIGGRAGGGKTYMTKLLTQRLEMVTQVGLDEFHFPKSAGANKHYDFDRIISEVILPFKENFQDIKYQRYNLVTQKG